MASIRSSSPSAIHCAAGSSSADPGMGKIGIIGAGIIGLASARALQCDGHDVTVFDPDAPGAGCSFGNAGHIALDHIRPLARPDVLRSLPRLLLDPLGPLCLEPA